MPSVKTPKSPPTGDYNEEPLTDTLVLRGKTYKLQELFIDKYDDLVEMATSTNQAGDELLDQSALRKLIAIHSLVQPRRTSLAGIPMRLANKLVAAAWELNFGLEPEGNEKVEEPDVQEGEPEEEGEG